MSFFVLIFLILTRNLKARYNIYFRNMVAVQQRFSMEAQLLCDKIGVTIYICIYICPYVCICMCVCGGLYHKLLFKTNVRDSLYQILITRFLKMCFYNIFVVPPDIKIFDINVPGNFLSRSLRKIMVNSFT